MYAVTIANRILEAIRFRPQDDDLLAKQLGVSQRPVRHPGREDRVGGRLRRYVGPADKIVNTIIDGETVPAVPARAGRAALKVAADDVKRAAADHLEHQGFEYRPRGLERGIDIDARHPEGRRYVIEADGGVSLQPQEVS